VLEELLAVGPTLGSASQAIPVRNLRWLRTQELV